MTRAARPGRRRTPVVLQSEATECGAACLGSVLGHYGRWVSMAELRESCSVGRDGSSGADLLRAARRFGLDARGWRRAIDRIHLVPLPVILFWEFNHFVVLEGVVKGRFHLNDPASGRRIVDYDTFDRGYTGVTLEFAPGPEFETSARPPGVLARLWLWLRDFKPALALAGLLGLLLAVTALAAPLLVPVLVDRVLLPGQVAQEQTAQGGTLAALLAGCAILAYLLVRMQMRILRRLAITIGIARSDRFLTHLFRLPMQFFAQRLTGDLLMRAQAIDDIARKSTVGFVSVAVEAVMCLAFLVVMVAYDALLACGVLALAVVLALCVWALTRVRTDYNHVLRREQGLLSGAAMAGLRCVQTLRASARDSSFFARWAGYQANEVRARQAFAEIGHVVDALPGLFLTLGAILVLGVGGWQVASGTMTIGTLMGFYLLAGNFLRPIGRMMVFANELQTLSADLQRLDDVFAAEPAPETGPPDGHAAGGRRLATVNDRLRMIGHVELRDVTFGFQPHKAPLISDFNLTIQPGQRVALVGPTGSGKTSLSLLIAGVYRPWSGQILFDGHPLEEVAPEVFSESVAMVDQSPILFQATVRENLTLWDPTIADHFVVDAARDAGIHDLIINRLDGYDARVAEGARNFSGGQSQRLEIARALVRNPSLLILDEATSALDAVAEADIDRALRRRGCSCVIVAHRLSTIRDSDAIIVLQNGREVQRGRHDELIREDGLYRSLIDAR